MTPEQKAQLHAMLETNFNRVNDPIPQAEYDLETARARLVAMLDNGQKLDPPLVLFPGPAFDPSPINTADPLRARGQAAYIDPVAGQAPDDLYKPTNPNDYKSFAEELDAEGTPPVKEEPSSLMTRAHIQAKLAEELDKLATPKLVYSPPPPTLGPGYVQELDDGHRANITSLQRLLDEPTSPTPAAPPIDPLAPEPLEKAQADYDAASAQLQSPGPEIEPE